MVHFNQMNALRKQSSKNSLRAALNVFDFQPKLVRRDRIRIATTQQESAVQAASSWDNVWADLNAVIAQRVKTRGS